MASIRKNWWRERKSLPAVGSFSRAEEQTRWSSSEALPLNLCENPAPWCGRWWLGDQPDGQNEIVSKLGQWGWRQDLGSHFIKLHDTVTYEYQWSARTSMSGRLRHRDLLDYCWCQSKTVSRVGQAATWISAVVASEWETHESCSSKKLQGWYHSYPILEWRWSG